MPYDIKWFLGGDPEMLVFNPEAILKGLEAFVYQFDGYSEHAKGWAKDGYNLFLMGARGEFDNLPVYHDEEDEDDNESA